MDYGAPWIVKESDGRKNIGIESSEVIRMDNGQTVASLHITAWKQNGRDARPAARLIAAAPDLLFALKELRDVLGDSDYAGRERAEAAISKAEKKKE